MPSFSWDTGTYGGSAFVTTAGWGWYNTADESFPSARLAANGRRPMLISSVSFLGGGGGGKVAKFNANDGAGERTSGLVSNPSTFRFVVRATGGGTTTFLRNTGAAGTIHSTNTSDTLSGQLPGTIVYTQVPTAPTITELEQASLTEAQVEWSAPTDNGGSAVTGYRVDWSTTSGFTADVHTSFPGAVLTTTLSGIEPGSTIYVRIAAINAVASSAGTTSVFSSTEDLIMAADVGDVDGWASYGTDPSGVDPIVTGGIRRGEVTPLGDGTTGLIREYTQTGSGGPTTAGARGIHRTFSGLTIGETYRLNGTALSMSDTTPSTTDYRWAVDGISEGDWATISDDATPAIIPEYEFVATATSHLVEIQADAASWSGAGYFERVAFYGITLKLVPNPTDYFVQDVELESSLANHYTLACATVGAAWWVGADNVTRFRQAEDTPGIIATFSDMDTPGTIPYHAVSVSQSTKNIANILTITNYGIGNDITTTFTEEDSVAAWGPREARLSLSLYDADTYLPARAAEVFARLSVPHRVIRSVSFNAQRDLSVAQHLEIQERVAVTFEGVTDVLRVIGIRHTVTADRWLITLDLSVWGYPEAASSGIGISSLESDAATHATSPASLGAIDLDTITNPGTYYQDTDANATLANNYPLADATGVLEVSTTAPSETTDPQIVQRYTRRGGTSGDQVWVRRKSGTDAWREWKEVAFAGHNGIPYRMSAGHVVDGDDLTTGSGVTQSVTFPTSRFTQAPMLVATPEVSARLQAAIVSVTTSGASVRIDNFSGATASDSGFYWMAAQILEGAGAG